MYIWNSTRMIMQKTIQVPVTASNGHLYLKVNSSEQGKLTSNTYT